MTFHNGYMLQSAQQHFVLVFSSSKIRITFGMQVVSLKRRLLLHQSYGPHLPTLKKLSLRGTIEHSNLI